MMKSRDLYKIEVLFFYINMDEFKACDDDISKVREWLKNNDIHTDNDYALYWSASNGYLEIVRELIKLGADVHAKNDEALYYSILNGHLEIVRELIKAGADIHICNDGALRWSASNGYLEIVRELIKAGADIHTNNSCPLRCSVKYGHLEVARELLKYYKYIRMTDYYGSIKPSYEFRTIHYINIISIMIDIPSELYDEIARFI